MASVAKLETPKKTHGKSLPKKCKSVDEFYALYDEDGFMVGDPDRHRAYHVKIIRPTTMHHANIVVSLYKEIYQGTYPYLEMLDPTYVKESFADPKCYWGIFRIEQGSPEAGTDVGCFTIVNDFDTRTAYFRGLNVLPQFHKKVGVRELATSMCVHFLNATMGRIDKWYIEARTAHNKVQYISRLAGCKTQALLLNKDYFLGKKESDCLQVAYWDHALESRRVIPKSILPEILPFYYRAQQMHNLPHAKRLEMIPLQLETEDLDYHETFRILTKVKLSATRDKYGYVALSIKDPQTGSFLTALHTESVKNIEKIKYHCTDVSVLAGFYLLLKNYSLRQKVEYVEWQVPVSDVVACKFLFGQNFTIMGYIPAWIPSWERVLMFEDAVVFTWTSGDLAIENIKLLPEGEELLDLITMNHDFSQDPLILPEIERIITPTQIEII
uniref:Uncharacterized protein n=1 Tax=Promethearchaeum syntrophicum TaxID=2594042 RepID=A0A5B9DFC5_9ARCH|nr:hypothetical protein [Candidatus Prometheoarchaeum syntrophicum]QEE17721.1 hypothetical protein DSAG12_03559 [Candidatus Prometheoarchaeum syntrophicum]